MGEENRLALKVAAVASALILLFAWVGHDVQGGEGRLYLVIYTIDGELLIREAVHFGQNITVVYNHSVMRIPVLEVFQVKGEGPLYLTELISREPLLSYPGYEHYYSYRLPWDGQSEGPLPSDLDIGQNDWFIVKGIGRARVMPLMVGSDFVDHKMLVNSKVLSLRKIAGSGEIVNIFITEELGE